MIEELIDSCRICVSPGTADAFCREAERMADFVGVQIGREATLPELIGHTPYTTLRAGQTNRALLMKFILRFNACELLVRSVVWEYRALHSRGVSFGYLPLEFATWKVAAQLYLERPCAQDFAALTGWLIAHHEALVRSAVAGEGLEAPPTELSKRQESFLTMLLIGDTSGALELADRAVRDVGELKSFYLDTVAPALHKIGLLWETNQISVAEEHLAAAIVGRIEAALYLRFARAERVRGKKALVAAGPDELHEVGARMVADFLELEGWEVTYLGGNLGEEEILSALKRIKPFLLSLSLTSVFHLEGARRLIQRIKAEPETQEVRVMVGGYALNCLPQLRSALEADGQARDAQAAACAANAWWEQREP